MKSFHRQLTLIVVILSAVPMVVAARGAQFRVEKISTPDAIASTTIYTIMQDRKGFLWFGTRSGLVKYDGIRARSYFCDNPSDTSSPPDCVAFSAAEDSIGNIWAGTLQGGLYRLDRYTGSFVRFHNDPADPRSLPTGRILTVMVAGNGSVWCVTSIKGSPGGVRLVRHDARSGRFFRIPIDRSGGIPGTGSIIPYVDRKGVLWACSSDSVEASSSRPFRRYISRYDPRTDRFRTWNLPLGRSHYAIVGDREDGSLAIARTRSDNATSQLHLFDSQSGQFTAPDSARSMAGGAGDQLVMPFLLEDDGTFWYSVAQWGRNRIPSVNSDLYRVQTGQSGMAIDPTSAGAPMDSPVLATSTIRMVMRDRMGTIWVATDVGLLKLTTMGAGFTTWRHDIGDSTTLSASRIRSVLVDRAGLLWVGTDHGLNRHDDKTNQWRRDYFHPRSRSGLPHSTVNVIYENRSGQLLLGTNNSLAMYHRPGDRFVPPWLETHLPSGLVTPWAILTDANGQTWVGDSGGRLYLFDSTGRLIRGFQNDPLDSSSITGGGVWDLFQDSRGGIWIATNEGLCRLLPGTTQFRRYTWQKGNPRSLRANSIWALSEDSRGDLWVCAHGGGISRYDRATDDFTSITTRDGLPSNNVYGLLEDDQGMFWISTARGLARWNRRDNTFRVFDQGDGIQGNEFTFKAFFKAPDGTLYFGGTEGLTAIRPELLRDNRFVPPLHITRFGLFDSVVADEIADDDTIHLDYDQNFFSFGFAALDYINPGKNLYAYRLQGVDPEWVLVGSDQQTARYRDLDPGTYMFQVRGSNNDGIWNEQGTSVTVIIASPWWGTWWFRSILALSTIGLAVAAVRARINLMRRIEQEKQQTAIHAALESQEAERQRIAQELHDGVGQMLAAAGVNVSYASQMMRLQNGAGSDLGASLERTRTILERASADIRSISHALGTISLKDNGLITALGELLGNLDPHQRTRFEFETLGMDERLPDDLETGLFRVAQELIANVLRHADASEATVQIVREENQIRLTVEDNGIGFDTTHTNGGMGRRNIAARVAVMNGRLDYDVSPGHGTTVTVTVHCPSQSG